MNSTCVTEWAEYLFTSHLFFPSMTQFYLSKRMFNGREGIGMRVSVFVCVCACVCVCVCEREREREREREGVEHLLLS